MKMLMLGLMMVFAVASVTAADEISVTRDRVEKKIKNGGRYIFVTNKVDRVGSVKGCQSLCENFQREIWRPAFVNICRWFCKDSRVKFKGALSCLLHFDFF